MCTATHSNAMQHNWKLDKCQIGWCAAIQHNAMQHKWKHSKDSHKLQYIATHCNAQHHTATHSENSRRSDRFVCCNTLQHTPTYCNTLHHTATYCNTGTIFVCTCGLALRTCQETLQHTAPQLQHTATHCYTMQHNRKIVASRIGKCKLL